MKNRLLISRKWFYPALVLFLLGSVMGLLFIFKNWTLSWLEISQTSTGLGSMFSDNNLTNEISLSFVLLGLIGLSFMRVRDEDEFVYQNRLMSWQWSVLINYGLLFVANWVFYGGDFLNVMVFSMVSIPVIFLVRFHFKLYQLRRHEE